MRILVTGATGFIGTQVMKTLGHSGHDPIPLVGDVRERETWEKVPEVDAVAHLAARVGTGESMYRPADYASVNVVGTAMMLEHYAAMGRPKIVLASSSAVYGDTKLGTFPLSQYGVTKLAQENMLRAADVDYAALRLYCVYGPGQSMVNPYTGLVGVMAASLMAETSPLVYDSGTQRRDLIHVDDAARAIVMACRREDWNGPIEIGTGIGTTVLKVIEDLRVILGGPEPTMVMAHRAGDSRDAVANPFRAQTIGFTTSITWAQGCRSFCQWVREKAPAFRPTQKQALEELGEAGMLR